MFEPVESFDACKIVSVEVARYSLVEEVIPSPTPPSVRVLRYKKKANPAG
jgi:hypothetical protein